MRRKRPTPRMLAPCLPALPEAKHGNRAWSTANRGFLQSLRRTELRHATNSSASGHLSHSSHSSHSSHWAGQSHNAVSHPARDHVLCLQHGMNNHKESTENWSCQASGSAFRTTCTELTEILRNPVEARCSRSLRLSAAGKCLHEHMPHTAWPIG